MPSIPIISNHGIISEREWLNECCDRLISRSEKLQRQQRNTAIRTAHGLDLVDTAEIICCQSENNYTKVHLTGDRRVLVSKTPREVADQLPDDRFLRVHHSFVANLDHMQK